MSVNPEESILLSGNEAIALGAHDAGAKIGVAYPGTPSTETMEAFAKFEDVYAEWAPNEKVALEVAIGAAMYGKRSLVTMKHVGVNVAADPLFTLAYTGVNAGLVILAADDPGIYSSQNEQDSRFYSLAAKIPALEPCTSSEAREFTALAYDLSEAFDLPILIRSTVRLSHTKAIVKTSDSVEDYGLDMAAGIGEYKKDLSKWVMMPAFAKVRRTSLDRRIDEVIKFAETSKINKIEIRNKEIGIISSGVTYENVREALPDVSTLKLGMTYPLSKSLIEEFASKVDSLYVVEEGSDYLSLMVKSMGFNISDYPSGVELTGEGEITPSLIRKSFGVELNPVNYAYEGDIPSRPPALCPGCPHRVVFAELAFMKAIVTGDIGCYTLAALPPLSAMDSCVDMGASISMAHGVELAKKCVSEQHSEGNKPRIEIDKSRPVVAVIGDSTFAHSGITSLLGTIYNQGSGIVCILDNRTTAMTGQQGNPLNGISLQGRQSRELDLIALLKGLGIDNPQEIDPMDRNAVRVALKDAAKSDELSVLIFKSPCYLIHRNAQKPYFVNGDCRACGNCSRIGCPAIGLDKEKKAVIDTSMCVGCGHCKQYCSFGSIVQDVW